MRLYTILETATGLFAMIGVAGIGGSIDMGTSPVVSIALLSMAVACGLWARGEGGWRSDDY